MCGEKCTDNVKDNCFLSSSIFYHERSATMNKNYTNKVQRAHAKDLNVFGSFLFFFQKIRLLTFFCSFKLCGVDDLDLVCGFSVAKTSANETKNKRVKLMTKKQKAEENDEKEGGMKNKIEWKMALCELWAVRALSSKTLCLTDLIIVRAQPRVRSHTTYNTNKNYLKTLTISDTANRKKINNQTWNAHNKLKVDVIQPKIRKKKKTHRKKKKRTEEESPCNITYYSI